LRRLVGFAVIGLALFVAGCGAAAQTAIAPSVSPSSTSPTAVQARTLPTSWTEALADGRMSHGPKEQLTVKAVSTDGTLAFAESDVDGGPHEFVMIHRSDASRIVIESHDSAKQILGAGFDGRYVAFTEQASDRDHWVLWVWDTQTGRPPVLVARNAVDGTGQAVPGPLNLPIADRGRVFWVQADEDGTSNLRVYDTATATTTLLRRGHAGTPFVMGRLIVWAETRGRGLAAQLSAISLDGLSPAKLPAVLAALIGPTSIDAGDGMVAWVDPTMTRLYVWSGGAPEFAVRSSADRPLESVHVAGEIVTWDDSRTQWALDLRTMAYTKIGPRGGTGAWGSYLLVAATEAPAGRPALADQSVVDTAALRPLPRP
jgi:hypothetical protein